MSQWHYIQNGQKQGPVSSDDLRQLAAGGALSPDDRIWKEGMSDWAKAGALKGLVFTAAAAAPAAAPIAVQEPSTAPVAAVPQGVLGYYAPVGKGEVNLSRKGLEMLRQTKPWVRFISIMIFIGSGLMTVVAMAMLGSDAMRFGRTGGVIWAAIVYLALGILYIVPGIYLGRYASGIANLLRSQQDQHLEGALEAQKSFWRFIGILMAVILGIYVLILIGWAIMVMMR